MHEVVYLNGDYIPKSKAFIHADDRGFYFADGVYEVIKYYKGSAFCFSEHMERLKKSLGAVKIDRVNIEALEHISNNLILMNELHLTHSAVYLQITRGVAPRSHKFPDKEIDPTLYGYAFPMPFPEAEAVKGIKVTTTEDIRWKRCDIKSIALLPNVLKYQEAAGNGAGECVFIRDGILTECSHSNIMAVKDNIVFTHPECNLILSGITRKVILNLCSKLRIEAREEPVKAEEIHEYDEFFITGTGSEVLPVVSIDGKKVGKGNPGNITRLLQRAFYEITYNRLAGDKIQI